jgi:hypothetical protein
MYDSFYLGMASTFLVRIYTLKGLRWSLLSSKNIDYIVPLTIVPHMIIGGLVFSGFDLFRRAGL